MSPSPSPSGFSNLKLRALSAIVLVPLVLAALWAGGWAFAVLIMAVAGAGAVEAVRLLAPTLPVVRSRIAWGAVLVVVGAGALGLMPVALGLWGASLVVMALLGRDRAESVGLVTVSFYVVGPCLGFLALRATPDQGLALALFLAFAVWGTDTGAYFAGRLIGGPKLLPRISPKKTWAGLGGGMALAALFGYGVAEGFGASCPVGAACLAAVMAVVAQAGDFFESWLKRRAGVKDSGTLIPGHGGVLDRVDGLFFAAAFLELYRLLGGPVFG